jgi:hypothetical protein
MKKNQKRESHPLRGCQDNTRVKMGKKQGLGGGGGEPGPKAAARRERPADHTTPSSNIFVSTLKITIHECETGYFFSIRRGNGTICTSRRDYPSVDAVKLALVEMITAFTEDNFESFDLT